MSNGDAFPVVEVEGLIWSRREAMGSKNKFWYLPADEKIPWLFKYPQENTGQHWAEKIAAVAAGVLGIPHAVVELATFRGTRGSTTKSFTGEDRQLAHGNEVLDLLMPYDRDKRFGQSDHTLENIFLALDRVFASESAAQGAKKQFAGYLVLDALIGNTDRHHENWGVVVERTRSGYRGFLAPTFDHASSLGRELLDDRRRDLLRQGAVNRYSERARGPIYRASDERRGPSPLALLRNAAQAFPILFRPALSVVEERRDTLADAVARVPESWMSSEARDFAVALIRYNAAEVLKCLK